MEMGGTYLDLRADKASPLVQVVPRERPGFLDVNFGTIAPETSARRPLVIVHKVKGQETGRGASMGNSGEHACCNGALRGRSIALRSPVAQCSERRATSRQAHVPTHGLWLRKLQSDSLRHAIRTSSWPMSRAGQQAPRFRNLRCKNTHSAFRIRRTCPPPTTQQPTHLQRRVRRGPPCVAGDLAITRVEIPPGARYTSTMCQIRITRREQLGDWSPHWREAVSHTEGY